MPRAAAPCVCTVSVGPWEVNSELQSLCVCFMIMTFSAYVRENLFTGLVEVHIDTVAARFVFVCKHEDVCWFDWPARMYLHRWQAAVPLDKGEIGFPTHTCSLVQRGMCFVWLCLGNVYLSRSPQALAVSQSTL